ncbi:hypothetical protein MTR_4g102910 [Medicago truncatula]|uniref:Uncharacterized protein n=1 Tax=Medicago truncatula TaxID=3880 RepID=A0A072UPE8_MEDTR|nr:hypothetical protein MTR_4g102910 [Medicago truncatula]
MEWNDMKIVQSNHLTNQGKRWLASQSVGKFRSVTLKNSSRVDAESKCSCVDHKLSVNRIIKRQKLSDKGHSDRLEREHKSIYLGDTHRNS